jgi:thiosulfate dehydrogenase [quinone] large subunit
MTNPTTMGSQGNLDWRSDTALAYAILRLTFGVNLCFRGVVRITINGLDGFSAYLTGQFESTWIPLSMVNAFGHVVPFVEVAMGLMLILGLFTRPALVIGGLMMTSLTFGTMFLENFDLAWLQLTYAIAFFMLLATRSWNVISLDSMLFPSKADNT